MSRELEDQDSWLRWDLERNSRYLGVPRAWFGLDQGRYESCWEGEERGRREEMLSV